MTGTDFDRFEELKKLAGESLNLPPDASRSTTLASLQLLHEQMIGNIVAHRVVDAGVFVRLTELLDKINPPGPPLSVTVEFVDAVDGPLVPHCRRCGWEPGDDIHAPHAPPSPDTIDGEVVKPQPQAALALPAPQARPSVPIHELPGVRPPIRHAPGGGRNGSVCW